MVGVGIYKFIQSLLWYFHWSREENHDQGGIYKDPRVYTNTIVNEVVDTILVSQSGREYWISSDIIARYSKTFKHTVQIGDDSTTEDGLDSMHRIWMHEYQNREIERVICFCYESFEMERDQNITLFIPFDCRQNGQLLQNMVNIEFLESKYTKQGFRVMDYVQLQWLRDILFLYSQESVIERFALLKIAQFLDIQYLVAVTSESIVNLLQKKSLSELRRYFGISMDGGFTLQESRLLQLEINRLY